MFRSSSAFLSVCAAAAFVAWFASLPEPDLSHDTLYLGDLSPNLQSWYNSGKLVQVNGHDMFVKVVEPEGACKCSKQKASPALILVHGFPSSSFDYWRALPHLTAGCNCMKIVMFDHVGFGFSAKPTQVSFVLQSTKKGGGGYKEGVYPLWTKSLM